MPICFQPGRTFPVILSTDKSQENPPRFLARALTCAEAMEFAELFDSLRGITSGRDVIARICDALEKVVVGWEGMPVEFAPGKLRDVLTLPEARELAGLVLGGRLSEAEQGK